MARLDLARIQAKCIEDGDCLLWTGKTYKSGAPAASEWLNDRDNYVGVRRRAYEEYNGVELTDADMVTTTCRHPGCLAKAHLALTTTSDRARLTHQRMDAGTKLRRNKAISAAQRQNHGKLLPEQVQEIKESEDGPYIVARRLGVSGVVASRIKRGEAYKDYIASPFAGLLG